MHEHYESPQQFFGAQAGGAPPPMQSREQVLADTVVRSLLSARDDLHFQRKQFDEEITQLRKELSEMDQRRQQATDWWHKSRSLWDRARPYLAKLCEEYSEIESMKPMIRSIQEELGPHLGMDA